jgi:outer membrane protein OmpA-like peptidoglycan-associated protein
MAQQAEKQSEKKKNVAINQPATPQVIQSGEVPADFLQALSEESPGTQTGLFNDPRLHQSNASDLRLQAVNLIRQRGGNTQIQRMVRQNDTTTDSPSLIQREDSESFPILSWLDRQRHNLMEATGLESADEAERGRATAFYAHGTYGPLTTKGAGGRGGFNVTYDPTSGTERITIKGGVKFIDGLSVSGGTVTPGNAGLQGAANQATALSGAEQAAFIAQYQWAPTEKAPFVSNLVNVVRGVWGSSATGLSFFINKPQWEWITAHVDIDIQLRAMDATDTRAADDHLVVNAYKEPPGGAAGQGTGAVVRHQPAGATTNTAFDQEMDISSQDILPRGDNMLTLSNTVTFDHDSVELSPTAKSTLDTWVATYQGAPTQAAANPTQVTIQGYTSASGSEEYNLNLGLRRTEAVRNYIISKGFTNADSRVTEISFGESGSSETATPAEQERERRVELYVDNAQAQIVAAHEFGHAFGLGDEYATGAGSAIQSSSGGAAGTAAGHDTLVKAMTDESGANLPGAIRENTDSIMSLGNVVRPQHYATFHNALVQVTGVSEWSIRS